MAKAKRRAGASVSLTVDHRRMAARIDRKIKQLDVLGLLEVEILPEMAEYMPDFHHLMMNTSGSEMDALCEEYAGFFRFAKILETVASGIASGKIKVPGGRTVNKEHKIAAAIDLRVRQLEAKGVGDAALLEQMVGHILDLQWLWSTVSDEKLAFLCRELPRPVPLRYADGGSGGSRKQEGKDLLRSLAGVARFSQTNGCPAAY